ncbi:MFS transporter [Vulcanisaeta souniana JCM 11219]|nr:MFS transporter [Vulcanisaeta souniana JCM 11219]
MDAYDMTLVIALTPILNKVFLPAAISPFLASTITLLGYALTLLFRPIGSALFGHFGDRIGRRDTLLITLGGIGAASALTAALPTYAQVGLVAYGLFAMLRAILGIFAGGEYAAGHPFAMEQVTPRWRGLFSGWVQSGWPLGSGFAGLVVLAFEGWLGPAMYSVGWRYAFLTGLIPVVLGLAVRLAMNDTPLFQELKKAGKVEKAPFFALFKPPTLWNFLQVLIVTTAALINYYAIAMGMVNLIPAAAKASAEVTAVLLLITGWVGLPLDVLAGLISDFTGRRRLFIYTSIIFAVLSIPILYAFGVLGFIRGIVGYTYLGVSIMMLSNALLWGPIPAYLTERFPTSRRASGVGFGYSLGLVIPAFTSVYIYYLHKAFLPIEGSIPWFTVAIYFIISFVLFGIGAYLGPETKGVDLREIT